MRIKPLRPVATGDLPRRQDQVLKGSVDFGVFIAATAQDNANLSQ